MRHNTSRALFYSGFFSPTPAIIALTLAFLFMCSHTVAQSSDSDSSDESALEKHELRAVGSKIIVSAERDLSRQLSSARSLYRKAVRALLPVQAVQRDIALLETRINQATEQMVVLNAQLANVRDVATNNRLVGSINSLEGQIQLAGRQLDQLKEQENKARTEMNEARETYVQHVLDMRILADEIDEIYSMDPNDPMISEKLKALEEVEGEELTFGLTSTFRNNLKKLVELENSIHSESIQLRREGDTFWASVVIDGEHTVEMIVDSGASLISIPPDMARKLKLEPTPRDQRILLTLADGSQIVGYLKKIKSVRVGQFTVEDVECAVLGPEATNAEPLLGMSFLSEFQFQLNAAESTLGMTRVDDESSSRSRRR